MLQADLDQSPIASFPQLSHSHGLGNRPFNSCPGLILLFELGCLLPGSGLLQSLVIGLRVDGDGSTLSLGFRTITYRGAHRAVSLQEVDVDNLHSVNGARLLPPPADFALRTDGSLVLPVNFKIRNRE